MNLHAARLLFFAVFCLAGAAGGSAVYFCRCCCKMEVQSVLV
jgi:hypothetical protein